jgi:hypothetical protein
MEPLIGGESALLAAADTMLAASQNMLAASSASSAGASGSGVLEKELFAEAVETGFLRALRRDTLAADEDYASVSGGSLSGVRGGGIQGTGYGRMGASITGSGKRSQVYGTIGGALGYAVGGPVGALVGGMLGGLLGGDDDDEEEARQQEELRRQWLNTPEGFEIEAYLYNLATAYRATDSLMADRFAAAASGSPWMSLPFRQAAAAQVVVNFPVGGVQITGQGEEAGERAARAFAGALGRVLQLNSVVVPAAAFGGDL